MKILPIIILLVAGLLALNLLFYLKIYLRARRLDVPLTYSEVIALKLDGYPPGFVVDAYVAMRESNPDITIETIKAAYKSKPEEFRNAMLQRKMQEYQK